MSSAGRRSVRAESLPIPCEAVKEYGVNPGTEEILIYGSKSSGGFVMAIKLLLKQSKMGSILTDNPDP